MGYRLYLGKISKDEHDKMQKMSHAYLVEKYGDAGDDWISVYDLVKEIHEFGKYYDVDTSKYNHFFANEDMQKRFSDHDFWIVDKEFLLGIIQKERDAVAEWYEECKTKTHEELLQHIDHKASEWKGNFGVCPYDMKMENPRLVASWFREYTIFDLVRIYKTFDWDNDLLVYYGW